MVVYVPTLIAYTATLFAVIGILFFAFWLRESSARWLLWCSLPFIMAFCASILLVEPIAPSLPGLWVGRLAAWLVLLAYGFAWQAMRSFYGRPPVVGVISLCATLWLVFSATLAEPWHLSALSAGMRAGLVALFSGLAAYEFWRSRAEPLPSRPILLGIFAAYAVFAAVRIPLAGILPAPLGSAPARAWSVIVYNLNATTQAMLVSAFMIALSRERVALQNYQLATRDPLTGAFNRRAFDEQSAQLVQAAYDAGTPLTLLLFDLDHFKSVNDRFGHDVGDQVIRHAVQAARHVLRQQDKVFRMGGEEFVCLLPGVSADQALLMAERLRRTFQAGAEVVAGQPVRATLSIGIAAAEPARWQPRHLLAHADTALYEAKRAGRNRTVMASGRRVELPISEAS